MLGCSGGCDNRLFGETISMGLKRRSKSGELLVGLEPAEALGGFHHTGCDPSERHTGVLPTLHIAGDAADGAHHVLGDVGAGERAAQLIGQLETYDGEDFVEPLENARGNAWPLPIEAAGEVADELLCLGGIIELPSLTQ